MRKRKGSRHTDERAGTLSAKDRAEALMRKACQTFAPFDGDAEARLRWLVDFSQQDLKQLSEDELLEHETLLAFVALENDWSRPSAPAPGASTVEARRLRRSLGRHQSKLRDYFRTLERNEGFYLPMQPRTVWLFQRQALANGKEWKLFDGPVRQETTVPQLVLLAHRLLGAVGPGKLKACPLVRHDGDAPCGRLFLAQRSSKEFCSHEHAQKSGERKRQAAKERKGK
jgi:hypothetical protein